MKRGQGLNVMINKLFDGVSSRTILAPMAGYTDLAFRKICHSYGAGLTVTEMVSSKALVMGNELSRKMLTRLPDDGTTFCQIFGHEPSVMADSVRLDEVSQYEGIDINMGCPVRKIVSNGDGSALLESPTLAAKCISAVKLAAGDKPVSVKFRLGVYDDKNAVDFVKTCRDAGADFVTVHFRTRRQMYSGTADYTKLPQIASCGIPVFANGDVLSLERYMQLKDSGAYGVSVGRGALGRPYIFAELIGAEYSFDLYSAIRFHTESLVQVFGDRVACNEMKKHIAYYLKGKRNAKNTTVAVMSAKTTAEMLGFVDSFLRDNPQFAAAGSPS